MVAQIFSKQLSIKVVPIDSPCLQLSIFKNIYLNSLHARRWRCIMLIAVRDFKPIPTILGTLKSANY